MFGRLFGKSKPKPSTAQAPELSFSVESSIIHIVGANALPPMPGAAQRAFQLSTDPNAEAHQFIDVIESDEALAARVVRIANSVYFERGKKSSTIEEAVLVIGIEELRSLLNASTLSEIFPSRNPLRAQLWANDIATAIIAKALAARLAPQHKDNAFLGGLMHDVGKLLLVQRAPDMYVKVIKLVEEQGISFAEAEAQVFVFDHCEVGQLIGMRWSFSEELTDIIRLHHSPLAEAALDSAGPPSLSTIVQCADIIAHALGLGHSKGMNRFRRANEEKLPEVWSALRMSADKQRESLSEFERTYSNEYDLYVGNAH